MPPITPLPPSFLEENKVDAAYLVSNEQLVDPLLTKITNITNLNYGFRYIQTTKKNLLLTGPLEARTLAKQYSGKMRMARSRKDVLKYLRPFMRNKKVGLNYSYLTAAQLSALKQNFSTAKFIDISTALFESRAVKTKEEIKKIKEAAAITQEISHKIPNMLHQNMSEFDLVALIQHEFSKNQASEAFPTLVCFGNNTRDIHHFISQKKLKKNETVLVDFGAKFEGYCSDLSRTMHFGKASEAKHALYARVFEALQKALEQLIPEKEASAAHIAAEKFLGHKIPHAIGHGVGLETHDSPGAISPFAKWKIKEGMVLAIEPGSYSGITGIRIEDDIVVTKDGIKLISKAPKTLIEV